MSYITDELRAVLRKQTNTVEIPGQMMHEVLAASGAQRRTILRGGVGAAFPPPSAARPCFRPAAAAAPPLLKAPASATP